MKRFLISAFVIGVAFVLKPNLPGDLKNWMFPPDHSHLETLIKPVEVKGWSEKGLQLADGRWVLPKGMLSLPKKSELLHLATLRGVDVLAGGEIYGLVKVFHGCGNDPVRNDLRRMSLADLLAFYGEGEFVVEPDSDSNRLPTEFYRDSFDFTYLRSFEMFQDEYHEQISRSRLEAAK